MPPASRAYPKKKKKAAEFWFLVSRIPLQALSGFTWI